eukprot:gene10315-biopygen230
MTLCARVWRYQLSACMADQCDPHCTYLHNCGNGTCSWTCTPPGALATESTPADSVPLSTRQLAPAAPALARTALGARPDPTPFCEKNKRMNCIVWDNHKAGDRSGKIWPCRRPRTPRAPGGGGGGRSAD